MCGRGQGGGPPEKGTEVFQLSVDEENHQDAVMCFNEVKLKSCPHDEKDFQ